MDWVLASSLLATGLLTGFVSSMLGVGGGFLLVPVLNLVLGMPIHRAVAISLASIIATAVTSSSYYAAHGLVDFRTGVRLEVFSVGGALLGGYLAPMVPASLLKIAFGTVLLYASYRMLVTRGEGGGGARQDRMGAGYAASFAAGLASALLGIGGGTLKVPVMVLVLGMPTKVAIATSTFMIGLTAAAGAMTYQVHGILDPAFVAPCVLGIFAGASLGSRAARKVRGTVLRRGFGALLALFALRMLLSGLGV